jgi:hypothetical protein
MPGNRLISKKTPERKKEHEQDVVQDSPQIREKRRQGGQQAGYRHNQQQLRQDQYRQ